MTPKPTRKPSLPPKPPKPPEANRPTALLDAGLFVVVLRPAPPGADYLGRSATYRLRLALKVLLRRFGLKAVAVKESGNRGDDDAGKH